MSNQPRRDLDVIALGSIMAEISPPDNRTRVTEAESLVMVQAGSATTFALAFQKLGGKLGFISRLGQDEVGEWIRQSLEAEGVDTSEVRAVPGQLTPISLASVDASGKKTFAYYRFPAYSEPLGTLKSEEVPDAYLQRSAIFDLTESSLRSPDSREVGLELARRCRALGVRVCVNPNYRPTAWKGGQPEAVRVLKEAMRLADLAIMNGEEASLISGETDFDRAIMWLAVNGPGLVAVTHGELPAALIVDGRVSEVPAVPSRVVFDIGAGDTFHAAFLAHYTAGNDPAASGRFAAQAAALKIQRPPLIDQLPTKAEVLAGLGA
ncbi:MAG: sugar kinase [Thermomicrobiales bacterium]